MTRRLVAVLTALAVLAALPVVLFVVLPLMAVAPVWARRAGGEPGPAREALPWQWYRSRN